MVFCPPLITMLSKSCHTNLNLGKKPSPASRSVFNNVQSFPQSLSILMDFVMISHSKNSRCRVFVKIQANPTLQQTYYLTLPAPFFS